MMKLFTIYLGFAMTLLLNGISSSYAAQTLGTAPSSTTSTQTIYPNKTGVPDDSVRNTGRKGVADDSIRPLPPPLNPAPRNGQPNGNPPYPPNP